MRNQEGKIELQKKVHKRICLKYITFLAARPPFCLFAAFFFYSFPLLKRRICGIAPIKIYSIAMGGILCDIMSKRLKI